MSKKINIEDFYDMVEVVEEATRINDTTGALMDIAKFFDLEATLAILEHIDAIHDIEVSMPKHLSEYRLELMHIMLEHIKKEYGKDFYDMLYKVL